MIFSSQFGVTRTRFILMLEKTKKKDNIYEKNGFCDIGHQAMKDSDS